MAPRQAKPNVQKVGRQPSAPKDHGKRPQGIEKGRPHRKSARLKNLERRQERTIPGNTNTDQALFPRVEENPSEPLKAGNRKRRRPQESESPLSGALPNSVRKRLRTSVTSSVIGNKPSSKRTRTSPRQFATDDISGETTASGVDVKEINPIEFWTKERRWPKEQFQQDDPTREDLQEDSWYEKYWVPEMNHLLARKKSSSSFRRRQSEAGSVTTSSATPSDQKPREVKSAPYQDGRYQTILASRGSFMGKSELGSTDASKSLCRTLLEKEQTVPQKSLFRDVFHLLIRSASFWRRLDFVAI